MIILKKSIKEGLEIFGGMFLFLLVCSLFFRVNSVTTDYKIWLIGYFFLLVIGRYIGNERRARKIASKL